MVEVFRGLGLGFRGSGLGFRLPFGRARGLETQGNHNSTMENHHGNAHGK